MEFLDSFIHIPNIFTNLMIGFVAVFIVYLLFNVNEKYALIPSNLFVIFASLFVIWWIGSRVVDFSGYGDRETYARHLMSAIYRPFPKFSLRGDFVFHAYVWICGHIMGYKAWFWLTAAIYVSNYARACVRMVGENASVMFLLLLVSFGFTAYATNTLRAGLAASFLVLAITYYKERYKALTLVLIALGIHFSMAIPLVAMLAAYFYDKTKLYLCVWIAFIGISFVAGRYFEAFFSSFNVADRASGYFNTVSTVYKTGFRWDFLIFSSMPIIAGYYYRFRLGFKSDFYNLLLNTYILANAMWILVIRVPFTDRFAYLSWFWMPFVLTYPLLKVKITKKMVNQVWLIVLTLAGIRTLTLFI